MLLVKGGQHLGPFTVSGRIRLREKTGLVSVFIGHRTLPHNLDCHSARNPHASACWCWHYRRAPPHLAKMETFIAYSDS